MSPLLKTAIDVLASLKHRYNTVFFILFQLETCNWKFKKK